MIGQRPGRRKNQRLGMKSLGKRHVDGPTEVATRIEEEGFQVENVVKALRRTSRR